MSQPPAPRTHPALLILNSGSSSIKYQVRGVHDDTLLASGEVERIGAVECAISSHVPSRRSAEAPPHRPVRAANHGAAIAHVFVDLRMAGVEFDAIGHRVVHGGTQFRSAVRITPAVLDGIRATLPLAPLHNPPTLTIIEACMAHFPDLPQVAVFDTAFHRTLPEAAFRYAVPEDWYRQWGVRRHGFHGIAFSHLSRRAAQLLGKAPDAVNLILLHLGNGASACAVQAGQSVDTSMGMTPLEGLVMGSRCGDIDPGIPAYLHRVAGLTPLQIDDGLNRQSGLRGLCGQNDLRAVLAARADGDASASLAFDIYVRRIKKYLGAYLALLGHVDAIVFSGGVGEHAAQVRAAVCTGLDALGIRLDTERNAALGHGEASIQQAGSSIALWVIPSQEEGEIARQVETCLRAGELDAALPDR